MVRAPFFDRNGLKKGAWSPEEDEKLKAYVERYGHWNWRELPRFAGLQRCGKSCRLRWMNYLRPNVKRGNFTQEEEDTILRLHAELGNKWSVIAANLPGRTDNEIKNQWHTNLKKRAMEDGSRFDGEDQSEEEHDESNGDYSDHYHANQNSSTNNLDDAYSHPILESSSLSPLPSSDMSYSIIGYEHSQLPDTNQLMSDTIVRQEEFLDAGAGDFWTEPFVPEGDAYSNNSFQVFFDGGQFNLPYDTLYDDNHEDLLYQVMQEFPKL